MLEDGLRSSPFFPRALFLKHGCDYSKVSTSWSWQCVLQSVVRCSWFCSADGREGMGRDDCLFPKSLRLVVVHLHNWRLCSAQLLKSPHSFIWTCTNNLLHTFLKYNWSTVNYTQLILICTSRICEFAYLFKFIYNPEINTHNAFSVLQTCAEQQNIKNLPSLHVSILRL